MLANTRFAKSPLKSACFPMVLAPTINYLPGLGIFM